MMEMLGGTCDPWDFDLTGIISSAGVGFVFGGLYNCGVATRGVLAAAQWGFFGMQLIGGPIELETAPSSSGFSPASGHQLADQAVEFRGARDKNL